MVNQVKMHSYNVLRSYHQKFNSLPSWIYGIYLKIVIYEHMLRIKFMSTSSEIAPNPCWD